MPRKLTDTDVEAIRGLGAAGVATGEIATRFSISERHARRLLTDLPPPRLEVRDGQVVAAVERLVASLELSPAATVTAEAAVVVARRLEGAHGRDVPALARQLVDLTEALRGSDEPDRLDEFLRRSEARRPAARASAG